MISEIKKLNFLLSKRERKGIILLTILLFIGMIFEVFGLGILIPALTLLLDNSKASTISYFSDLLRFYPNLDPSLLIHIILLLVVVLYVIKTIFLVFLNFKQNQFLSNLIASITNKLFSSYLFQSYDFHLNNNSSTLIKNLQIEINHFKSFVLSLIMTFIEGGFIISILLTIVFLEPLGAISIGLFYGFLSILFFQFTKRKLYFWGNIRQDLDNETSKISLEGLGGIKDLIVLNKMDYFISNFSKKNYLKARLIAKQTTLTQIPRFYLELISIIGLVSFISIFLFRGKDVTHLISVLGVFVAATFRMIPSFNRIISSLQIIKFHKPSLNIIYSEIKKIEATKDSVTIRKEEFIFSNKIEFLNVSFFFDKKENVLNDINLTIKKGQIVGIVGESGSGKSTLIDLLLGLFVPTDGKITIDGIENLNQSESWRDQIGYVSQSIYLIDGSIKSNIAFGIDENQIDTKSVKEILNQCHLEEFVFSLENGIETKVGERGVQISGGQKQRIGLARALYRNPSILILDEATSALDYKTEKQVIKSLIRNRGNKTIIMIAHRLETLEECDFVFDLNTKSYENN